MHDADKPKSLSVLYFIGSYGPEAMGSASHEQTILAMRERGHQVEVLTQINQPGVGRYTRVEYSGVPVYRVNVASSGSRRADVMRRAAAKLFQFEYLPVLIGAYRRHLRSRRYDLVHVEGAYPYGFVSAIAGGSTPYMANVQGADVIDLPEHDYGYRRYRLPRLAVAYALRRAALIRVISPLLADYLEEQKLATRDRMVVILRAIEDRAFPPDDVPLGKFRAEARAWLAGKYGVGLDRPVVMTLSRLHPFKGLEYLVDAIPQVKAAQRDRGARPPWFLICGPSRKTENFGDYREFLLKRAQAAGVAGDLIFTGQVPHPDVRRHLAGADLLACPSVIEAQNKVVPEAAAVGTPSVVTETTGIAAYFSASEACVSVPPRAPAPLAEAIVRLLAEPAQYAEMQVRAMAVAATLRSQALAPLLEEAWRRAAGVE
jgi:glycosyltransferase involved in cell wall biosynthesis